MRKHLIFILFAFTLGCKKENSFGPEFNQFVGVWKEEDGESISSYEFTEYGSILYKNGIDRGFKKKVIQFSYSEVYPELGWKRYTVLLENGPYMSFLISDFGDSLWAGGRQIDNESVQQQTKQFYTRAQ